MSELAQRHALVLQWAHALTVQVDRVHAARLAFMESTEQVRRRRHYAIEDSHPAWLMKVDSHLCLVAANSSDIAQKV